MIKLVHDDVIKWKHFPRYWHFVRWIHRSSVNSPHKGQWRGALMFSLICAWINGWANNREAGDLRRHRSHYDVTVMVFVCRRFLPISTHGIEMIIWLGYIQLGAVNATEHLVFTITVPRYVASGTQGITVIGCQRSPCQRALPFNAVSPVVIVKRQLTVLDEVPWQNPLWRFQMTVAWKVTLQQQYALWIRCPVLLTFIHMTLQWRHNGRDCVSNHQPRDCLLNRLFRLRSKKTSKLRVTGLCAGNSPGPVNSPHKWPVTRKMFPFDDIIMIRLMTLTSMYRHDGVMAWKRFPHNLPVGTGWWFLSSEGGSNQNPFFFFLFA